MRRRSFQIALFLSLSGSAHALIDGNPIPDRPDLVRLVFRDETMCTGFYVDAYTIVTAAHCLGPVSKILSVRDEELKVEARETFAHPDYTKQMWPSRDVGVIKTSKNPTFRGDFTLAKAAPLAGSVRLFGCGIATYAPKVRTRSTGENFFVRVGAVSFALGQPNARPGNLGPGASIASNDSGGPVTGLESNEVFAIATQSTAESSVAKQLPVISVVTSVVERANAEFIAAHLGAPLP